LVTWPSIYLAAGLVASPSRASAPMMPRMDRFSFPRAMPRSCKGNDDYDLARVGPTTAKHPRGLPLALCELDRL
jgi:hypothetical protein